MRSCLGFLVFTAAAILGLAYLLVEYAVPAVVTSAVRSSPLAHDPNVAVAVDASLTGVFLHGSIDRVVITGSHVTEPNATVSSLSVTVRDVSILDRTFASAYGTLTGVTVDLRNGPPIPLSSVAISGSSTSLTADVDLGAIDAELALRDRLRTAGVPVDSVGLGDGRIDLVIGGKTVAATLVTTPQGVSLQAGPPIPTVPIFSAPQGGEWQIDDVQVSPAGLRVLLAISLR